MSTVIAYIIVIFVWATTPLGIKWSSEGFSPLAGAFWRIFIAAIVAWLIAKCMGITVPRHRKAILSYSVASIGLFLGMVTTYIGASYLSSGMISVLFGLSPIISSVIARYVLDEPPFGVPQWVALSLAITGLIIVFRGDVNLAEQSLIGLALIVFAVFCFSLSGILIKKIDASLHTVAQTSGSLLFAVPLFGLIYILFAEPVAEVSDKSIMAILYLAFFGSIIGFFSYFYVLERLPATAVSLSTLVTPVLAIALGVMLNGEQLTSSIIVGAALISGGLCIYHWGDKLFPA